ENEKDEVEGTLWEADGELGVVLSHGAAYDADSWEEQGKQLAENDITAFAVEDTDKEELIAAAEWLEDEQDIEEVAILGASAGGTSAIEAVEEEETLLNKVVLLSPGGDATVINGIPVVVVYNEGEGFVELEDNQQNKLDALSIPGEAHAQELVQDNETVQKGMEDIRQFFDV